jgi:hypothetical protein
MAFHVYVLTGERGSCPLVSLHDLPWQEMGATPVALIPLGTFPVLEQALQRVAEFARANIAMGEPAGDVPYGASLAADGAAPGESLTWLATPRPEPESC